MKIIETGSNVKNFKECDYIGKWQVSEYFCPSAVNIVFLFMNVWMVPDPSEISTIGL